MSQLDGAIRETHRLRDKLYTDETNISIDILWECLVDERDEKSIRILVKSPTAKTITEIAVQQAISLQIELLQHIQSFMSVSQKPCIAQGRFDFCLRQSFFIVDTLPDFRNHILSTKEHSVRKVYSVAMHSSFFSRANDPLHLFFEKSNKVLFQTIELGSSYLSLLASILRNSVKTSTQYEPYRSGDIPFDKCIAWCAQCTELVVKNGERRSKTDIRGADKNLMVEAVFNSFISRLTKAFIFVIADGILDILSVLGINAGEALLEKLIEYSWISLHTIYTYEDTICAVKCLPYGISMTLQRISAHAITNDCIVLKETAERALHRIEGCRLADMRRGVLRHLGLLTKSTAILCRHIDHISTMICELQNLCDSFATRIRNELEDNKSTMESKRSSQSSIFGLETATLPDFFDMVLHVVLFAVSSSDPALKGTIRNSPYQHLETLFSLFRRLVEIFKKHLAIFPKRVSTTLFRVSKDILLVAVVQLRRCVTWRDSQPILSIRERNAGTFDPGAISFLEYFLAKLSTHSAMTVLSFCDFWQSHERGDVLLSRCTSLRFAAEKAACTIIDIAKAHHLPPPSFDCDVSKSIEVEDDITTLATDGFHQGDFASESVGSVNPLISASQSMFRSAHLQKDDDSCLDMDSDADDDSETSFGANWGNAFDADDSDNESLNLQGVFPLK